MSPRTALYFGFIKNHGHGIQDAYGQHIYRPEILGCPWSERLMDTGLLKNGKHPDIEDGKVFWTCGGHSLFWYAFFWWDRSGDKRPNSNSGFYVSGFEYSKEGLLGAWDFGRQCFPEIVKRQKHSLVLWDSIINR